MSGTAPAQADLGRQSHHFVNGLARCINVAEPLGSFHDVDEEGKMKGFAVPCRRQIPLPDWWVLLPIQPQLAVPYRLFF